MRYRTGAYAVGHIDESAIRGRTGETRFGDRTR